MTVVLLSKSAQLLKAQNAAIADEAAKLAARQAAVKIPILQRAADPDLGGEDFDYGKKGP
jgi:hypothetical protein